MRYTTIPGTDLRCATICLGTSNLGSTIDRQASFDLLDAYVDLGGNAIDTASVYADWLPGERSISEKTLGRWCRERGNRDRILLATKGGHPDLSTMHISRLSRAEIVHDIEASLSNLQTDIIDLYWLHRDDPKRSVQEIIEVLHDQVEAGKIRTFGCSNWRAPRIRAAQAYAAQQGLRGFVADQMQWSLARADPDAVADKTTVAMDDDLYNFHLETGLAAIPYSSQANGFYQKLAGGARDRMSQGMLRTYDHAENRARFGRIQALSEEIGLSVTQIALGYLLSHPFPAIPIVGCKTVEHLRDSLSAADVRLTPEQVQYLSEAA
jgi:aryl-alcohol dehydrogenase-like predicted oxidoreductase